MARKAQTKHNVKSSTAKKVFDDAFVNIVNTFNEAMVNEIKKSMRHKSPPPSKAGDPPGVKTGTLRRSLATRPATQFGGKIVTVAGTNVKYARFLEFAREPKRRRPFFAPVVKAGRLRPLFEKVLSAQLATITAQLSKSATPKL